MLPRKIIPFLALIAVLFLAACGSPSTSNPGGGGSSGTGATIIQSSPNYLSFLGNTSSTLSVSANGSWTVESGQTWLTVTPNSGSGNTTVTVNVDRSGITPGNYAATLLFKGSTARETVTTYMRFPNLSGNVTGPTGQVKAGSVGVNPQSIGAQDFRPGEVLVQLNPAMALLSQGVSLQTASKLPEVSFQALQQSASRLAIDYGLKIQRFIAPNFPWVVLDIGQKPIAQTLSELQADGRVEAAQPNYIYKLHQLSPTKLEQAPQIAAQTVPSDPLYPYQWDMNLIGMPQVWNTLTGTSRTIVAVVDSGVQHLHPDLNANIIYPGYDFVTSQAGGDDLAGVGHGTHVAGTIGAVGQNSVGVAGMNWNVSILPVRVCDNTGCPTSAIVAGIEYAAGYSVYNSNNQLVKPPVKANVINLSLGGTAPDPMQQAALSWAVSNGVVVVAASGNNSTSTILKPTSYPAAFPEAIAVGSADYDQVTNIYSRSSFSNGDSALWVVAPGGTLFNNGQAVAIPNGLYDPGYGTLGVVSTYWDFAKNQPIYAVDKGTSMAAPHVSGLAALMLSVNPQLTPALVKLLLSNNTFPPNGGYNTSLGFGLINAPQAVQAARNSLTAFNSDFIVRLRQGSTVVMQARADVGGNFTMENIPAGSYTLEAGTDPSHSGVLGLPGSFYGSTNLTVGYNGDITNAGLNVQPQ